MTSQSQTKSKSRHNISSDDTQQKEVAKRLWRRSESPVESFSDADGADENGNWSLNIVGEEVDYWGIDRHEVEWGNWQRSDGTNATWKPEYTNSEYLHKGWRLAVKRDRANRVKDEGAPVLPHEMHCCHLDVHNEDTRHANQAVDLRLRVTTDDYENWPDNPENVKRRKLTSQSQDEQEGLAEGNRRRTRSLRAASNRDSLASIGTSSSRTLSSTTRAPRDSIALSSVTLRSERATSSTASHQGGTGTPAGPSQRPLLNHSSSLLQSPASDCVDLDISSSALSAKAIGKRPAVAPRTSELVSISHKQSIPQDAPLKANSRRQKLSRQWSRHGAPITFSNDVDDEDIPPLCPNFEYIERGYSYDVGVEHFRQCADFLLGCSGHHQCLPTAGHNCECQDASSLVDEQGNKICAYDDMGLFQFNVPRGVEVLECTPNCQCSQQCPNRVLQQERKVSLDIFKTRDNRGWGVRTTDFVRKGTVLGMYTGLLHRRNESPINGTSYCFALDHHEVLGADHDDSKDGQRYTVNCEHMGNWSRFINHSCEPNLKVFLAVYDQVPDTGVPYIAFAATRDLLAGEELTFDYSGGVEDEPDVVSKKKGKKSQQKHSKKGKREFAADEELCFCKAKKCRGYI